MGGAGGKLEEDWRAIGGGFEVGFCWMDFRYMFDICSINVR